jgi:hypothetical protein
VPKSKLRRHSPASLAKAPWPYDRAAMPIYPDACQYVGGISRSMFYREVLPYVDCLNIGVRRLPLKVSLDRYVAARAKAGQSAAPDPDHP